MSKKRMIIVAIVLFTGVGLDQWSKIWADDHLGTHFHPVPIVVDEANDGKTLHEVVKKRFSIGEDSQNSILQSQFRRLSQKAQGSERAFPVEVECARPLSSSEMDRGVRCVAAYVVFHHESLDLPPRRVPNRNHEQSVKEHANDTVDQFIRSAFPYLPVEAQDRVIKDYVYRVPVRIGKNPDGATYYHWDSDMDASLNQVVKSGEIYVALRHNVVLLDSEEGPPLLQFKYAENPGAAWSLFADKSETFRRYFFITVSIGAIIFISFILHGLTAQQGMAAVAFGMVLSGAIGNFIDRLRFNYVIDFIDMHPGFSYPTYNVADIAITFGVLLLLVEWLIKGKESFLRTSGKNQDSEETA